MAENMIVTIMYRNSFEGGDGWEYYPLTIQIPKVCPKCGGPRGDPRPYTFCEDGEWFTVDQWTNPCGHLDLYKDVFNQVKEMIRSQKSERMAQHA